jgi:hypothetical protein
MAIKIKLRWPRFQRLAPCSLFLSPQRSFFVMTDLTMLHAPSALHLPDVNETGFRFTFNRRSLPPPPLVTTTPMVTVEMVDGDSPPSSPVTARDDNLLSPPRRTLRSKKPPKLSPPRPHSAPPGPTSGETRFIDPHDPFPPHPKTPDSPFSDIPSTASIVRPPTILCACIVPFWNQTSA